MCVFGGFKMNARMIALCAAVTLACGTATAATVTETTDAGRTMDTAFALAAGTTVVEGSIQNTDISDVDLYSFILDAPTTLTIRMLRAGANGLDANLILFNGLGQGLAGDDDNNSGCADAAGLDSLDSCLTLSLDAGAYFLGAGDNNIAAFANAADASAGANTFIDNDSGILATPTLLTLGVLGAQFGDIDVNDNGAYRIEFSTALGGPVSAVPLPASLPLLAGGLLALAGVRRFRRKA